MLQLKNLRVTRGDFAAHLSSLHIMAGECVALCGVSGSGKSTLLEALSLLTADFTAEKFSFDGLDITSLTEEQKQALRVVKMGIMPQVGGLLPFLTLAENWKLQINLALRQQKALYKELNSKSSTFARQVLLQESLSPSFLTQDSLAQDKASTISKLSVDQDAKSQTVESQSVESQSNESQSVDSQTANAQPVASQNSSCTTLKSLEHFQVPDASELFEQLQEVISTLGLSDYQNKLPEQLSIGQRQRALFIRAIAHAPRLLLIDEPTSSLDPDNAVLLFELIEKIATTRKMGVVVVTHDLDLVSGFKQYTYQLKLSHSGFSYFAPQEEPCC